MLPRVRVLASLGAEKLEQLLGAEQRSRIRLKVPLVTRQTRFPGAVLGKHLVRRSEIRVKTTI